VRDLFCTRRGRSLTDNRRAQFESRLKLWNFRKYLNGDGAWRYVADRISKRESQGRRSRVIVSGIAYDDEKVRREIARCRPCTLVKVDEGT